MFGKNNAGTGASLHLCWCRARLPVGRSDVLPPTAKVVLRAAPSDGPRALGFGKCTCGMPMLQEPVRDAMPSEPKTPQLRNLPLAVIHNMR